MSARSLMTTVASAAFASATTAWARSRKAPLSQVLARNCTSLTPAEKNARATSTGAFPARAHTSTSTTA